MLRMLMYDLHLANEDSVIAPPGNMPPRSAPRSPPRPMNRTLSPYIKHSSPIGRRLHSPNSSMQHAPLSTSLPTSRPRAMDVKKWYAAKKFSVKYAG
jgi:hypothetical protein